ncbi:MAG: hypothetical protein M1819_000311 [Sarea resinae]|nr:MAG: hypothetical protein M1819_000311 [Sarea resinae]
MLRGQEIVSSISSTAASTVPDFFTFTTGPTRAFHFSLPMLPDPDEAELCHRHSKRLRPLTDVDGEGSESLQKKKRRLRLALVTSRLSRPYADPATHIVDRGISKIAVWAKQRALGRNLLRKAAIMNLIRRRAVEAKETEQRRLEEARQAHLYDFSAALQNCNPLTTSTRRHQLSTAQTPRRQYIPLPPSPLGLSNYDALDLEDEVHDSADEEGQSIYSDFNFLDPSEPVVDDYDSLRDLDALNEVPQERRPPTPPDEKSIEMLREKERQKELSFVHFG